MRTRPGTVRYYFSFRSPYSWLAHHDLCGTATDVLAAATWIPLFEPDTRSRRLLADAGGEFVYTPMSKEKHRYILQDVRRLARDRGLEVRWPLDREPRWEVPHLAYLHAADAGRGPAFAAAMYQARWGAGRDVCDPAVVATVAADLGLNAERLAAAADDPATLARGTEALLSAYRDGAFGVPFFAIGHDKFWGVDRLELFVDAARDARSPDVTGNRDPRLPSIHLDDGDHAGGCG